MVRYFPDVAEFLGIVCLIVGGYFISPAMCLVAVGVVGLYEARR